jgi:hypothetical protein
MPLNDVQEVVIVCTQGPQTALNVLHYQITAITGVEATLAQQAAAIAAVAAPNYKPILVAQATYYGVGVTHIWPLARSQMVSTTVNQGVGALIGDSLPWQTCGLAKIQTALAGRANRGRFYSAFGCETSSDVNGNPTVGYLAGLTTLMTALYVSQIVPGGGGNTTLTPVIYHRLTRLVTNVTGTLIRTKWASQRRRGQLGRPNPPPF